METAYQNSEDNEPYRFVCLAWNGFGKDYRNFVARVVVLTASAIKLEKLFAIFVEYILKEADRIIHREMHSNRKPKHPESFAANNSDL